MSKYLVSLIGAGNIAGIKDSLIDEKLKHIYTHAKAIHSHAGFAFGGVYDINRSKSTRLAELWSIPFVAASIAELLEQTKPDVVVVCSRTDLHEAHLKEIMLSNFRPRLIFVEKPACESSTDFEEILDLAENKGVDVLVNHTRRFDPDFNDCASVIKSGELGHLIEATAVYYGGWQNNGTHIVDTIRMLIGNDLSIKGIKPGSPGRSGDDCLDVILENNGVPVIITSFDEAHYQLFEFDFRFTQGRLQIRDFGCEMYLEKCLTNNLGEKVLAPFKGFPKKPLSKPFLDAYSMIYEFLEGRCSLTDSGAEMRQTRQTMDIIWECILAWREQ